METSNSIAIPRGDRFDSDSTELLKACQWAGKKAQEGYTALSIEVTEMDLIFTASKPE